MMIAGGTGTGSTSSSASVSVSVSVPTTGTTVGVGGNIRTAVVASNSNSSPNSNSTNNNNNKNRCDLDLDLNLKPQLQKNNVVNVIIPSPTPIPINSSSTNNFYLGASINDSTNMNINVNMNFVNSGVSGTGNGSGGGGGVTVNNLAQSTTQQQQQNCQTTKNQKLDMDPTTSTDAPIFNNNISISIPPSSTNTGTGTTTTTMGFENDLNTIINRTATAHNDNDNNNNSGRDRPSSVAISAIAIAQPCSSSRSNSSSSSGNAAATAAADPLTGAEIALNVNSNLNKSNLNIIPTTNGQSLSHFKSNGSTGISVDDSCSSPSTSTSTSPSASQSKVILSTQAHDHKSISTINYPEPESIELEFKPLPLPTTTKVLPDKPVPIPVLNSATATDEEVDLLDFDSSLGCENNSNNVILKSPKINYDISKINPCGTSPKFSDNYNNLLTNNNNSAANNVAGLKPSTSKMESTTEPTLLDFELNPNQSHCASNLEIAKVLETFNAILENEEKNNFSKNDLNLNLHSIGANHSECVQLVDNFTNLLIGGEDEEDLLIVVDEEDVKLHRKLKKENSQALSVSSALGVGVGGSGTSGSASHMLGSAGIISGATGGVGGDEDQESTDENNAMPSVGDEPGLSLDDDDDDYFDDAESHSNYQNEYYPDGGEELEGYESDRPMVRASMRKLRPVQMLPMPSSSSSNYHNNHNHSSYTIPENPSPLSGGGGGHKTLSNQHSNGSVSGAGSGSSGRGIDSSSPLPGSSSQIHATCSSTSTTNHHSPLSSTNSASTNRLLVTSLINNLLLSDSERSGSVENGHGHGHGSYLGGGTGTMNEVSNPMYGEVGGSSAGTSGIDYHTTTRTISMAALALGSGTSGRVEGAGDAIIAMSTGNSSETSNPGSGGISTGSGSTTSSTLSGGSSNISAESSSSAVSSTGNGSASSSDSESTTNNNNNNNNGTDVNSGTAASGTAGTGTGTTGGTSTTTPTATTARTTTGTGTGRTSPLLGPGLRMPAGKWPHRLSSVLALIGCTLGLNNICRFSLLSVEYGANFILQFLFLSLVFGIPLFTFHMSIGQYLSSGIIDMWRISPIFQGIGIGLVISQALIGIYTAVGVSWVFIYFRDSFITRYDQYRWGKCFRDYREVACDSYSPLSNLTNFSQSVPDYFNGVVLQRSNPSYPTSSAGASSLKFTVAFNLAVVWMLVFVSLSKGLKSYGKVVHGFVLIPVASLLVLASKMVGLVPTDQTSSLFGQTAWSNFFFNSQTWVVAAREAFFTWGLLGACVMQVTSHNRFTHRLKSDASIVVLITTFVLLLSAFLGNACYSVILSHGYTYSPSSFESDKTYTFLSKTPNSVNPSDQSQTEPYMSQHISFLMGVRIIKPDTGGVGDGNYVSGYQSLRLATELFPTTMAMLGHTGLSPFWTVLFYFTFILFGIAQQIAIWHCVIRGVIAIKSKVLRSWEITITFCVCATGFVLGLPLCTELGIFVEYFMDYAIGSGWWIMVLYLLELVAVFIVRGAPYCGENIVTVLMTGRGRLVLILAPLLSFVWNVILPVAMLVLTIASFKSGNVRELYDWNPNHGYGFWPSWAKELGSLIQLLPILAVPLVAIIQSCRYLSSGPPDLFDRMQQLYRPNSRGLFGRSLSAHLLGNTPATDFPSPASDAGRSSEDPPPKYTPPPSYSTATGAKIAKFLRASMRRSMRRFGVGPSTSSPANSSDLPPPPNYATVILEINAQQQQQQLQILQVQQQHPQLTLSPSISSIHGEMSSLGHGNSKNSSNSSKIYQIPLSQTLGRSLGESKERASLRRIASDITPRDIARILRTSFRRGSSDNNNDNDTNSSTDGIIFTTSNSAQTLAIPSLHLHQHDQYQSSPTPTTGLMSTFQNNLNYNNITSLHLTGHALPHPSSTQTTTHPSTFHLESDLEYLRVPIVSRESQQNQTTKSKSIPSKSNTSGSTSAGTGSSSGNNSDVNYNVDNHTTIKNNNSSLNNINISTNTNSVTLTLPNSNSSNSSINHHHSFNSNNNTSCSIYPSTNNNCHDRFATAIASSNLDRDRERDREARGGGQSHTRSRSSGGSLFMAAQSHNRGNSDTTDSQLTLISHSSSQNDLSNLVYNNLDYSNPTFNVNPNPNNHGNGTSSSNNNSMMAVAMDFRLGGIVNPSFQFSHLNLQRGLSGSSSNPTSNIIHTDEVLRQPASSSEA